MRNKSLISLLLILSLTLTSCNKANEEVIESVTCNTTETTVIETTETVSYEIDSTEIEETEMTETEETAETTTTSVTTTATTTVITNQTAVATTQVIVTETTQAKSYSCEMCGSNFTSKSQLDNHLEVVHGYGSPAETTVTVTPSPTATPTPTPTVAPKPVSGKADVEYDIDVWHDDVYGYDDNNNWVVITPGYTERITVTFSNVSVSFSGPYNDPYINNAGGKDVSNRIDSKYNWRWYSNGTIIRTYNIVYE